MNLKTLSELLGLSQTTVSRALNGYPEVSESTRIRVLQAATEHHYRPNARATGLATGRAMAIGHIIPLESKDEVVNPVFGEFIAGASQIYSNRGYELLLTMANDTNEEESYRALAAKGSVDGFIVHSPRSTDSRIALLNDIGLPYVVHGRVSNCDLDYAWVDIDNYGAFKQACKLQIDLGHQRIGLINGMESLNFAWERRLGYLDALAAAGLSADPDLMHTDELTETHGFDATNTMLTLDEPPTALLVSSYVVALGVRRALSYAGLRTGDHMSVIIHDDELAFFQNNDDVPQFTATRSSVREAGIRAASMLIDIINQKLTPPCSHLLESHLTIGESTAPFRMPRLQLKS